jgi:hypothetical protein
VAGERLGNAGCCPDGYVQGCWATGPHLHFYTTYRGARQPVTGLNLGGWLVNYDGCLIRTDQQVCPYSRIVSNSPGVSGGPSGPADIVVLLDSSGVVAGGPDDVDGTDAALALLQAARADDSVSIINFNSRVSVRSPLMRVATTDGYLDAELAASTEIGKRFGRTDLRAGLLAACRELLKHGTFNARAVVLISDGLDNVGRSQRPEECLAHHGVPVFAYRMGGGQAKLLEEIATTTGGEYQALADVKNLYCEFRRVRTLVSGDPPGRCSALRLAPGDVLSLPFMVPRGQDAATLEIRWRERTVAGVEGAESPGIKALLHAPSGRKLTLPYSGVTLHEDGGSARYTIARPLAGTWSLSVTGENIAPEGIYVTFAGFIVPQAPPPPIVMPTEAPSESPTESPAPSETEEAATPTPTEETTPSESPTPAPETPEPETPEPETPTPRPTKPSPS